MFLLYLVIMTVMLFVKLLRQTLEWSARQAQQQPLAIISIILAPLALFGSPLIAFFFTPHIYLNFQVNYQQRMEVVRLYQSPIQLFSSESP